MVPAHAFLGHLLNMHVCMCVCVCDMEWPMDDKVIRLQQTSLLPLHTMHITKGVAIVIK